jgi:formylmethanofuran dehydrogenase subunit D
MHKGKASPEYADATSVVEMSEGDMASLGIAEGGLARLTTPDGAVELRARAADLPGGLLFVPMGTTVNALVGCDTSCTGMPSFKGLTVEVTRAGDEGGGP